MQAPAEDVRSWQKSGKYLLVVSISHCDPIVWSGRALQEVFVELSVCGLLHQCIRPLIGAFAPGHHGYQRAWFSLADRPQVGLFGSPGFACAGKTDPPSSWGDADWRRTGAIYQEVE